MVKRQVLMARLGMLLLLWGTAMISGCEDFINPPTTNYPVSITFSGTIRSADSLPIPHIMVVLKTPNSMDSTTALGDQSGVYEFTRSLEYAGPNRMSVRDIDGHDNGGFFRSKDTVFYLTNEQYHSRRVQFDFTLVPH